MLTAFLTNLLAIALDAAPWLLLGLLLAGLIKAWLPESLLQRWLGGRGFGPVLRGGLVGAPLPLCSCGAIPLGLALYRGGASRGATTAFMVGTPGVGVDSVVLTYALLGPFLAVFRPLAAIFSAVSAGLLVNLVPGRGSRGHVGKPGAAPSPDPGVAALSPGAAAPGCAADHCCSSPSSALHSPESGSPPGNLAPFPLPPPDSVAFRRRAAAGIRYSFTQVLDDISWWLLLGLILAALLLTLVPPGLLAQYATGPLAMLAMALVGIPMYLCAQAVTPVAAALILAGAAPGTVLVLLLAGPITSVATLSVLRQEFGTKTTAVYLAAVAASAIGAGLLADLLIGVWRLDIAAQIGTTRSLLPDLLKIPSLLILLLLAIRPLRALVLR